MLCNYIHMHSNTLVVIPVGESGHIVNSIVQVLLCRSRVKSTRAICLTVSHVSIDLKVSDLIIYLSHPISCEITCDIAPPGLPPFPCCLSCQVDLLVSSSLQSQAQRRYGHA